jgi:hypothetical protein
MFGAASHVTGVSIYAPSEMAVALSTSGPTAVGGMRRKERLMPKPARGALHHDRQDRWKQAPKHEKRAQD